MAFQLLILTNSFDMKAISYTATCAFIYGDSCPFRTDLLCDQGPFHDPSDRSQRILRSEHQD